VVFTFSLTNTALADRLQFADLPHTHSELPVPERLNLSARSEYAVNVAVGIEHVRLGADVKNP